MNIRSIALPVRKVLLTTAVVGGALTAASLFKTPGKTLNPLDNGKTGIFSNMNPASIKSHDYDNTKSVVANLGAYGVAATNNLFDHVIDPITEKPVIPLTTTTALTMLGVGGIEPRKKKVENHEIKNEMVDDGGKKKVEDPKTNTEEVIKHAEMREKQLAEARDELLNLWRDSNDSDKDKINESWLNKEALLEALQELGKENRTLEMPKSFDDLKKHIQE